MVRLNSGSLSIETLDEVLSGYKNENQGSIPKITLTSEFLYAYLQGLTASLLSDRTGIYKVLDKLNISFKTEGETEGSRAKLESDNFARQSAVSTIYVNSSCLDDVCDAHHISPSEIDSLIENEISAAFNAYVYKLEESDGILKIYRGNNVVDVIDSPENNSWQATSSFKIVKPPFSKAIQIHDEFKKRFISSKVICREFIDVCLPFISSESGLAFGYDDFLKLFDGNLVLAYEFILFFVDICYSRDFKKKR